VPGDGGTLGGAGGGRADQASISVGATMALPEIRRNPSSTEQIGTCMAASIQAKKAPACDQELNLDRGPCSPCRKAPNPLSNPTTRATKPRHPHKARRPAPRLFPWIAACRCGCRLPDDTVRAAQCLRSHLAAYRLTTTSKLRFDGPSISLGRSLPPVTGGCTTGVMMARNRSIPPSSPLLMLAPTFVPR